MKSLLDQYGGTPDDAQLLRELVYQCVKKQLGNPTSLVLCRKIRVLFEAATVSDTDVDEALDYYEDMKQTRVEIEDALRDEGITLNARTMPALGDTAPPTKASTTVTWLDAVIKGQNQVSDYVKAVLKQMKPLSLKQS